MKNFKIINFRKSKPFLILFLLSSLLLSACANVSQARVEEYKIGVIAPLTGFGAVFGESYLKGAELALSETDMDIKLLKQDSKFEGKASVDAANFLLNVQKVDVLNALFHLPAQSVNALSKKTKTPFVYEAYTRSMLDDNPYAFKSHFNATDGCEKLMQYAKQHAFYKKVGVLMAQTEYNQLCLDGLKKVEPNISEFWYGFGTTDFKTLLAKMNNEGIDRLVTVMIDFEYAAMFKQLTELGYPIKVMCATASECIYPQIETDIPQNVLDGTLAVDFIPPEIRESVVGKKYLSKYPKASFVELNYAVTGYETIKYTSQALKKCNSGDSDCIVEALKNVTDYGSVLGSTGFKDRVLQLENKIYSYLDGSWNQLQ